MKNCNTHININDRLAKIEHKAEQMKVIFVKNYFSNLQCLARIM